jgi:transposase-like protein
MTKSKLARYTLEFKQAATRLVDSGQSQAAAAGSLSVVDQTLGNCVKANRVGAFRHSSSELLAAVIRWGSVACVRSWHSTMKRGILEKRGRSSQEPAKKYSLAQRH